MNLTIFYSDDNYLSDKTNFYFDDGETLNYLHT